MGKGGGSQDVSTSTTNMPKWAEPYHTRSLKRGEALSLGSYQPYTGQRIAGEAADTAAANQMMRDIAGAPVQGMEGAMALTGANAMQAANIGDQGPYQFDPSVFQAGQAAAYQGARAGEGEQYDFGAARQFDQSEADRYMSPYIQNVMDVQKDQALQDYERSRADRDTRAVQAGAFGGSRAAVQEGLAEDDMLDRMARIQAEGQQAAFTNAQQQFGADRQAQLEQARAQAEEMARVQGISVEEAARVQRMQAEELARVQGISIDEAARVQQGLFAMQGLQADDRSRWASLGLEGLAASSGMAEQLANLGLDARTARVQDAQLLDAIGTRYEDREQRERDLSYEDWIAQRDHEWNQLERFGGILGNTPVKTAGSTTASRSVDPAAQAAGLGLAGIGLLGGTG